MSASLSTAADLEKQERSAKRTWVAIILGFFFIHSTILAVAITLALGDPSAAIIPNYYENAVNWDSKRRTLEHFEKLKWNAIATVGEAEQGRRIVSLTIESPEGAAVSDLRIFAEVYRHADGNTRRDLRFEEVESGLYTADIDFARGGLWQLNLIIEGEHGNASKNLEVQVD